MSIKSIILISLQMGTMAYLLLATNSNGNGFGLVIQALGLIVALWGIFTIKIGNFNVQPEVRSSTLIIKGPYNIIRNPMYTGVILIFLPTILNNFNLINLLVYVILIITLLLKIYSEEQFLKQRFSEEYLKYKKRTFRLIPYIF